MNLVETQSNLLRELQKSGHFTKNDARIIQGMTELLLSPSLSLVYIA